MSPFLPDVAGELDPSLRLEPDEYLAENDASGSETKPLICKRATGFVGIRATDTRPDLLMDDATVLGNLLEGSNQENP